MQCNSYHRENGELKVKTRTITKNEDNKWYKFENGNWRLCDKNEIAKLNKIETNLTTNHYAN